MVISAVGIHIKGVMPLFNKPSAGSTNCAGDIWTPPVQAHPTVTANTRLALVGLPATIGVPERNGRVWPLVPRYPQQCQVRVRIAADDFRADLSPLEHRRHDGAGSFDDVRVG